MNRLGASITAGVAAWCSLGSVGLVGADTPARVALLPPWWLLLVLIAGVFAVLRVARLSAEQISPLFVSAFAILPWLPVPLPAAALIWTGPFVIAIWVSALAGVAVARGWSPHSSWIVEPKRARLAAGATALVLYVATAWWLSPIPPSGDAPHYLVITQSLLEDGDVRIENNHQRGEYLEYYPGALKPDYLTRGKNGEIYSIHAPGLSAIIAPAFLLAGLPGATLFLAIIGAIGTATVWHLGYRLTGSPTAAWFGWASVALTSPFFFVVDEIFPDGIAATLVLVGMIPLIDPEIDKRSWRVWLLSGMSLAILPWLGSRLVAISVTAGICLVLRMRSGRQLLSLAVPGVIGAGLWFLYFYAIYGTFNPSAPYGHYTQMAAANLVRSVPGLLFDQQFGLLPNAPVYAFILGGVVWAAARLRRWGIELLVVAIPYMVAVGMWMIWWAGTSSPARYWTPLALLLGVAAARLWHEVRSAGTAATAVVALGVSVLITVALAGPDRGSLLFNFRDGVALWLEWASDLVDLPRGAPSIFRDTVPQVWLKAAIWVTCLAAAWLTTRAIGTRASRTLTLTTPVSLAAGVMIALTVSWQVSGAQPLTPETAMMRLLRDISPLRATAFDFGARSLDSSVDALSHARLKTSPRRSPARPAPLLALSNVPAGAYRIRLVGSAEPEGSLTMKIGTTLPFRTWTPGDSGSIEMPVHVASTVQSLVVDGDDQARRTVTAVELEPVFDGPAAATWRHEIVFGGPVARRALKYGSADAYFMDDHAFAEPTGFWVAGGQEADVLMANISSPLHLFMRNAPVENTVTIDSENGGQIIELGPGEEKAIEQHGDSPDATSIRLRIRAAQGFRPWQQDHANADMRYLGCWIEIR